MSAEKQPRSGNRNENNPPPLPRERQKAAKTAEAAAPTVKVPPLFRTIDWVTLFITTVIVFGGYLYTLAPDVTLEDSGELAVASYYAGVPHPPGYPVWTIYTWLFTELVPISNIAYRVAMASAFAGALACGLIGMMVSRGSSMMIESIEALKNLDKRTESMLCLTTGYVAAVLMAFNGFFWSQSVIVEVYSLSVLSLTAVLIFLLRWMYAPHQNRYLYLAFFMFGICFTNHMSLLLAAMGIEAAVLFAKPKLGRDLMLTNSLFFVAGLILKAKGLIPQFNSLPGAYNMMFVIFLAVGLLSVAAYAYLTFKLESYYFLRDGTLLAIFFSFALVYAVGKTPNAAGAKATSALFTALLFLASCALVVQFVIKREQFRDLWVIFIGAICFVVGVSLYFFMPVASMTNPPLNWGYPRTEEGFWHALTRGQYEKTNPTNLFTDPLRFVRQMWNYFGSMVNEFTLVYLAIALVPFGFITKMQKRERAWLLGLFAVYLCLAVLMMIMLNPGFARQDQELNRVFFTSSHVIVAMCIGYGLALLGAFLATNYQQFRRPVLTGVAVAAGISLFTVVVTFGKTEGYEANVESLFFDIMPSPSASLWVRMAVAYGLGVAVLALVMLGLFRTKLSLPLLAVLYVLLPIKSFLAHWEDNEQRGHLFGYWFGHDMFTPPFKDKQGAPLYPEMARDAVLFGGTDPGRFNPTYMIFCESFTPPDKKPKDPNFDRRDVVLITQNALADGTYLNYIRAHYNRSTQNDPPFFQELLRSPEESQKNFQTNFWARRFAPLDRYFLNLGENVEKRRRAGSSLFKPEHFTDLAGFANKLRGGGEPAGVSKFLADQLSVETKGMLGNPGPDLAKALARDLNKVLEGDSIFESNRFAGLTLTERVRLFAEQNPPTAARIRLNRLLLEEAYPKELVKSVGGVYPDREIHTPTPEDSQRCFSEYLEDVSKRSQVGQLDPGEDVRTDGGRVQVSGQVAVMKINALLTKVIFDKNPNHEFYVEESFPLAWMYPYLTPYGIIMKINRQPLSDLTEDMLQRDHEFWSQYSERLIGNWITYDTPVSNICHFAEKVYLHRNYEGFTGDRKFIRDDNGQKAFSKLRSSIGGVYAWRLARDNKTPEIYRPKTEEQRQRLMREAEFAFKQALAFCPYSPEAVFRYINLLLTSNQPERINDAILIAKTCRKLDPGNAQISDLVQRLEEMRKQNEQILNLRSQLAALKNTFNVQPNLSNAWPLYSVLLSMQNPQSTNEAAGVLTRVLAQPQLTSQELAVLATEFARLNQIGPLEHTLIRLTQVSPNNPEAFYDLAGLQAMFGRTNALATLRTALQVNLQRKQKDPKAKDIKPDVWKDGRFNSLRSNPEFIKLMEGP